MNDRLRTTRGALALLAVLATATAQAGQLDMNEPEDILEINRKIQCSTVDGEPITFWWHGEAYSRRQGERDKKLFLVEGMNVRACSTIEDPERGKGYKLVSREILLYKDPATGEPLATWDNPWTGETVDVLHVANDPVNFSSHTIGRGGQPIAFRGTVLGDRWWQTSTFPLFYSNPLGGDYQNEVGGTYHATEMFNFLGDTESLLDDELTTAEVQVGWVRMSDWLPWMMMGGREGVIYMHTAGRKLDSWDDMSETMKREIAEYYPEWTEPPPPDDARKNETSWEYYKSIREGEKQAPVRR